MRLILHGSYKMKKKLYTLLTLMVFSTPSIANIAFSTNQAEIVIAPECNHVPISLSYALTNNAFDESLITVSSDSSWAIPSVNTSLDNIEINFSTEDIIASYTATISVNDGENVTDLFISANVSPLNIYRLLDDPLRSITYGIQQDGLNNGSIIAFDPIEEKLISCITVGEQPTDFVINNDSTELLVINSASESIDVIALNNFTLKETISLPTYNSWGEPDDTTANIDLGPDDIIYYSDGDWAPMLHVLKRSTGEVLQSLTFNGSMGFMDFSVTSDKNKMAAMPQYGWSAGSHTPKVGYLNINEDGTLEFIKETNLSNFERAPFEAPVLISNDDQITVMKTISTDPANTDNLKQEFSSAVWSMNPNASVVATADKLYEYDTGIELYSIPGASINGSGYTYTKAQAFTSDYTRFIYFNASNRSINVVNLIDEIGLELLGRTLSPKNGSTVTSPKTLTWSPLSGVDQYDLYLGTTEETINNANHESPLYLGRITGTSFELLQTLTNGTSYFWRVDPVTSVGTETGITYNFTVSEIGLDINEIIAETIIGHSDYQVNIELASEEEGINWDVAASDDWITFTESTGVTPATLSAHIDTTTLSSGTHHSSITITSDSGELIIPIKLKVEPLNITHIRSDKNSEKVYAISEDSSSSISKAYLLEIDSTDEKIERVVRVGSSVTDFTIHYADELIYVTNWKVGNLLTIDKSSFEQVQVHAFKPAGATGYGDGDVYRVAAGNSERLVIEEEDQWIDISLYSTATKTNLNQTFVREGGGVFGPNGRYYYHGENNSSGASIIKFDTSGDTFTNLLEVRPSEISNYYGSRNIVISEDGSRIFWAGVALNDNLDTEWGVGENIYSTSADGRYAFGESAIFDINLKRQVLAMPTNNTVSGYNSTSEKLITQVDEILGFYTLPTLNGIPAPVLNATNSTDTAIDLSWTDKSLEMAFVIQKRLLGDETWEDIQTTEANITSIQANSLVIGSSYEFRVRAYTSDYSSAWSNIVIKKENDILNVLSRMLAPTERAIVNSPSTLSWTNIPWIEQYDIYLSLEESDITNATTDSTSYLGRATSNTFELSQTLTNGEKYFWRIDPITDIGPETGITYSFTVSDIGLNVSEINAKTFAGHASYQVDIQLLSQENSVSWTASASDTWVTFTETTGSAPSALNINLDSTSLAVGLHTSTITLTSEDGTVEVPVIFQVEPINITHIISDKNSSTVYAISEDTDSNNSQAYLLEINSAEEAIQRVLPVGSSVTDFTIHYANNLIYVTNWESGNLLAINKTTFEQVDNHIFQATEPYSYNGNDIYKVAAGASERLIIEEEDQWIEISLFNTDTEETLSQAHVREGGGEFGPAGRYYYHGENNSSGASIIKFDTIGDTFTSVVNTRPTEISNYYGSRTVVVSEDGNRIFWAGVALDSNLDTEWGIGETIYSTSSDGRYAFSENAIYDIDLKRQVLGMPSNTSVSGYNSTTEKLVAPVEGVLSFYPLSASASISFSAPTMSITDSSYNYADLSWTDNSLEMEFTIQQRILNSGTWVDVISTDANVTNWTANSLQDGVTYEFRIRATSTDYTSEWSNIALVSLPKKPNEPPIARDDIIVISNTESSTFTIMDNDSDYDGLLNPDSIVIITQPQYGQLTINSSGEATYLPGSDFVDTDNFTYTIEDNELAISSSATVSIIFNDTPAPSLNLSNLTPNSILMIWTDESDEINELGFEINQRLLGTSSWSYIRYASSDINTWTNSYLQEGAVYEFRVRAIYSDYSSPWSNIASAKLSGSTNEQNITPIANNDVITLSSISNQRFNLSGNDTDSDGEINESSIVVTTQPKFGQLVIHTDGDVTYSPSSAFVQTDSFTYTINDNDGESSLSASVSLIYMPTSTISISKLNSTSIELSWTDDESLEIEFIVQQRQLGTDTWITLENNDVTVPSLTAGNLQEGLTYEFRVRSSSSEYNSPWSNTAVATLAEKEVNEPEPTPSPAPTTGDNAQSGGGSFDGVSIFALILLITFFRRRTAIAKY